MYRILDMCFGQRDKITFKEFQKINEEISSDMLLSVLNLFREKLPCSENFWRYKRNYELHMKNEQDQEDKKDSRKSKSPPTGNNSNSLNNEGEQQLKKYLASPQMTKVKPLSPYMDGFKKNIEL